MTGYFTIKNTVPVIMMDAAVLLLVYFIPALSHLSPFPLYYMDPMRLLLFTSYLISKNNSNTLILAATIPLFSYAVTGHPVFYKSLLISIELLINAACFMWMIKKSTWHPGVIFFIAAIISKVFYYLFKYIFLTTALLTGNLKATDLDIQLATVTGLSLLFALFYKRRTEKL